MPAMPEYVPEGAKTGVVIAIPSRTPEPPFNGKTITLELLLAMAVQTPPTHLSTAYIGVRGKNISEQRDYCAKMALKVGAKYLWFIDDDTVPPPNTLKRLIYVLDNNPDIMVCGGVYVTKDSLQPQPVVFRGMGLGSFWQWKKGEVFEVTSMGAGCMLINTEIFKKIEAPYFPWPTSDSYDPSVPSSSVSEDVSFCNKVRAAGYRVFAHGGVLCDHFDAKSGNTYQMPLDSYPMRDDVVVLGNGQVLEPKTPLTIPQ